MIPLARNLHRFRLSRAGIHQVWQYDEVFRFGDGRLLLRGKNGAGKSKALEMLLPFLLDGNTRKLDAAGGGKTTLKWLMLDGWTQGTNRLGHLWVEFLRTTEEGGTERLTLGAEIKASTSTGEAKPLFFVTRLAVGDDLPLHDPARRPSPSELRELIGTDNLYDRPGDYRARVARELFGLTDLARYRNLVHLLYGLRRPTIGDRIESGELVKVLSDALPPLDDEIIDKVARNLDDLDTVRDELARLEKTDAALTTFLSAYHGYLRGVLRGRTAQVQQALTELRNQRRQAGDLERKVAKLRDDEKAAAKAVEELTEKRAAADVDLRALRESAAYQALGDLREKRETVRALAAAARTGWEAAGHCREGEAVAAGRLRGEADEIGRDLAELRGSVGRARRAGRSAGLDDALLAEPAAAGLTVLSAPATENLTDTDGEHHEITRPVAEALDDRLGEALTSWREKLAEAGKVTKTRQRAAERLQAQLTELATAELRADDLRRDVEHLEGHLTDAAAREVERGDELVAASTAYAGRVREWAERLPAASPLLSLVRVNDINDDEQVPAAERALDRDVPEAVGRIAHEITDPVLARYDAERDEALRRERAVGDELKAVREERRRWQRQADPEPARSPYSTAQRVPGTGAPLFLLLDFAASLPPGQRTGLEAALQASGLLSAWVTADGVLLDDGTRDVLLRDSAPVTGPSLADVMVAVPGHGVGEGTLRRLLRCIGLGETDVPTWVAVDGRWRLGVSGGAYGKEQPEYVGASVRAATRQRRIEELTAQIVELENSLDDAVTVRKRIEGNRDELRRVLREIPSARGFTEAWTAYDRAGEETTRLKSRLSTARRTAEDALAAAVRLRTAARAQATADGLPADREALDQVHRALGDLRATLEVLQRDGNRIIARLTTHAQTRRSWQHARDTRIRAEKDFAAALGFLTSGRRELRLLERALGASEQEIIAQEQDAQRRFDAANQRLPQTTDRLSRAHDDHVRAGAARDSAIAQLKSKEQEVAASGGLLRRPLGLPGLPLAAGLDEVETVLEAYDSASSGDVRTRITALRAIAEDIGSRLGPASADVSDSLILRRGEELRDGLAGGYDASVEEVGGIKRFALHDDTGTHDVAVVGTRIRNSVADACTQLSSREQQVFERYLLGELGDHLSRQVLAAHTLVTAMNETLDEVRSSHGIGARLVWELAAGSDADTKAAVDLVRRPSALRTRDQSAQLRDVLRRRIEDARRADPSAGYGSHLRVALDYRTWHVFKVKVTDAANPERERTLSYRTALSQGEQRVVSYLVLFATAAAHFSSLAGLTPAAPRLILLDDAFAKVDEPTHARLLGLLVELDLDFVITSERLWGCFATVPSLHVYECLRDPHVRGVAIVHFTWDGHRKRLVGI